MEPAIKMTTGVDNWRIITDKWYIIGTNNHLHVTGRKYNTFIKSSLTTLYKFTQKSYNVMARVKNNIVTEGISGTIGDKLVFKQLNGKTIISTRREQTGQLSPAQQIQRNNFQDGTIYANGQMADPVAKAEYQLKVDKDHFINAYTVAVSDFLNPPVIKAVDITAFSGHKGDIIRINAVDDFRVVAVKVMIAKADGTQVEAGNAVQDLNPNIWVFKSATENPSLKGGKVIVTALDKPGHEARLEVVVP